MTLLFIICEEIVALANNGGKSVNKKIEPGKMSRKFTEAVLHYVWKFTMTGKKKRKEEMHLTGVF
jgi:hypothetical protein